MAELPPGLDQLPGDLESAATPPPFGSLVERSRVRRRRHTAGAAIALAIAIVAIASGVGLATTRDATPPPPANTHHQHGTPVALDPEALRIIKHSGMFDYAVDQYGDTLTLWTYGARAAWALTGDPSSLIGPNVDGVVEHPIERYAGLLPEGGYRPYHVTATRIGFVVTSGVGYPFVISRDGAVSTFHRASPGSAAPGDVVFDYSDGSLIEPAIADLATRTWWPVPSPVPAGSPLAVDSISSASTTVGADGSYWMWASHYGHSLTLLQRPCTIKEYPPTTCTWRISSSARQGMVPGAFVALGHRFATFTTGDGLDAPIVIRWVVSLDPASPPGIFPKSQVPFDDVESMATTRSGILFVTDTEGDLWADDTGGPDSTWANFYRVDIGHRVTMLEQGLNGAVFAEIDTGHPGKPELVKLEQNAEKTIDATPWLTNSAWD